MIALGYALTGIGFSMTALARGVPMLALTVVIVNDTWRGASALPASSVDRYSTGNDVPSRRQ